MGDNTGSKDPPPPRFRYSPIHLKGDISLEFPEFLDPEFQKNEILPRKPYFPLPVHLQNTVKIIINLHRAGNRNVSIRERRFFPSHVITLQFNRLCGGAPIYTCNVLIVSERSRSVPVI